MTSFKTHVIASSKSSSENLLKKLRSQNHFSLNCDESEIMKTSWSEMSPQSSQLANYLEPFSIPKNDSNNENKQVESLNNNPSATSPLRSSNSINSKKEVSKSPFTKIDNSMKNSKINKEKSVLI